MPIAVIVPPSVETGQSLSPAKSAMRASQSLTSGFLPGLEVISTKVDPPQLLLIAAAKTGSRMAMAVVVNCIVDGLLVLLSVLLLAFDISVWAF